MDECKQPLCFMTMMCVCVGQSTDVKSVVTISFMLSATRVVPVCPQSLAVDAAKGEGWV